MNNEYMEEMVDLVNRMKEIVEKDPSMTIRIGSAVSLLEAAVMDHIETRIWRARAKVIDAEVVEPR